MFSLKSTKLIQQLKEKAASLAGRRPSSAIVLPPDLAWVQYQEFGTVGGYTIEAKNAKTLRLPATADYPASFPHSVTHPGVSPKSFTREILPEIQQVAVSKSIEALVESGYDPSAVQAVLNTDVMPEIRQMIADSMQQKLGKQNPETGKLGDLMAHEVYLAKAQIEDTGS